MQTMTNTNNVPLDAVIAAAGMSAFTEDCDLIAVHAPAKKPRIEPVFVADSDLQTPFGG